MARRKMESALINRNDIYEELRLISESDIDYITPSGKVYTDYGNDQFFPKKTFVNNKNWYVYINITNKDGKHVQRRLHRLLAIAYLPNPEQLEYVMHKDNNKENYSLENLKWGTASENTQQAHDDKLIVNDQGMSDSQSVAVNMYDLFTGDLIQMFGSISIASKELGTQKATIISSCENRYQEVRKPYYFRYAGDGNIDMPSYIAMYSMDTDEVLDKFINCAHASDMTGIPLNTISHQVSQNRKPRNTKNDVYFLRVIR